MKEQKRERRIRDKHRMKAKAVRIARRYRWMDTNRAMRQADYMAVCSCSMCGNPRKWFGSRTMQEIRAGFDYSRKGE